jgi:hypothetical protein
MLIGDVEEMYFDVGNVQVHRNVIFRKRWVHDSASAIVEQSLLREGHADSHDDAAAFSRIRSTRFVPPPRNFALGRVDIRLSASLGVPTRE